MGFRPFRRFGEPLAIFGLAPAPLSVRELILGVSPGNLIGYWPLDETSGTVADDISPTDANGAYTGTVTLAQASLGDGQKYPLFGGGGVSLATPLAALNTAMGAKSKGTLAAWVKIVNPAVWTDANARTFVHIGTDANNRVLIGRSAINGQIQAFYNLGGSSSVAVFTTSSPLTWFHILMTWDNSANQVKLYYNGTQQGATGSAGGTWAGSLAAAWTGIALISVAPTNNHSGYLAHPALWKIALTPAQVASLFVPGYAA